MIEIKKLEDDELDAIVGGDGREDYDYSTRYGDSLGNLHNNCGGLIVRDDHGNFTCSYCGEQRKDVDLFDWVGVRVQTRPLVFYLHHKFGGVDETNVCPPAIMSRYQEYINSH